MKIRYKKIELPIEILCALVELESRMFIIRYQESKPECNQVKERFINSVISQRETMAYFNKYQIRGISLN